jgi:glucosamine--fructose-6-phosphate aminotransferase (isomerizing)
MCWIFAYNWTKNSIPFLVEWLRNLEYRWYDSAWVLWVSKSWNIFLEKAIWKVSNLASKVEKNIDKSIDYSSWIAHTRWATHGKVTEENTHPHISDNKRFYIVHNWIIENYISLKEKLSKKYNFYSETDTEVVAKLIEDMFDWNIITTLEKVTKQLVWAYAIAVIDKENPNILVWAKLWSPMIVWVWEEWIFLSSDLNALNKIAHEFTTLEDNETIVIKDWKYSVYSLWEEINKTHEKIDENCEIADKWKFETFTEKEINEIPSVLRNALKWRIDFETKTIHNETIDKLNELDIENIEIIASWSSYFAWVVWKSWLEELAWIKTEVRVSSEFLYETFIPNTKTLYVFMSQSRETADVREWVKMVQQKWCMTFGIVNVVWSTIARMCDMWLYTKSWIEIWVASTKNIIWQLSVLLLISLGMWLKRNLQVQESRNIIEKLWELDKKLEWLLEQHKYIKTLADKYSKYSNFFYLGRNVVYWTACECSLKLKELSYVHAEAYSTWELKHWPLALVGPNFPCIVINPKWIMREKTISNVKEIQARNGTILWVITAWDTTKDIYNDIIEIPKSHPILTPFLPLIPLWIFSVEIAKNLNRDIDKPQNLAKSVTVE